MSYKIGIIKRVEVCRQAFRYTYKIRRDYFRRIALEIKEKGKGISRKHTDKSNPKLSQELINVHTDLNKKLNLNPTHDQNAAMVIANSPTVLQCWAWMDYYFKLVGDCEPNSNGEIHLEPCQILEIWQSYQRECILRKESEYFNAERFAKLWATCFP